MTVAEPWTAVRDTPNKSARMDVPRKGIVLHHGALTSISTLRDMEVNGTKQVSSTVIVKDNVRERIVADPFRAWSLSSAYWDSALRSIETCNESTNGWTISPESHESDAWVTAYFAALEGWWPHRDGDDTTWTVLGHRELYTIHNASYATACPGGMNLALVTARAQQILEESVMATAKEIVDAVFARPFRSGLSDKSYGIASFIVSTNTRSSQAVAALKRIEAKLASPLTVKLSDADRKAFAGEVAAAVVAALKTPTS